MVTSFYLTSMSGMLTERNRSRAAFKLLEIDDEFGLFNNCLSVLDLGCRPVVGCK